MLILLVAIGWLLCEARERGFLPWEKLVLFLIYPDLSGCAVGRAVRKWLAHAARANNHGCSDQFLLVPCVAGSQQADALAVPKAGQAWDRPFEFPKAPQ